MKVLVTGGGGFLGSAVCRQLLARGDDVIAYQRSAADELQVLGIEVVQGDITDTDLLERTSRQVDAIIHTAAKAGLSVNYDAYFAPNVTGTQSVLDACRSNGIDKLVFTSSPSVTHSDGDIEGGDESLPYPENYNSPYPATKALAEKAVMAANCAELHTVSLRPHLIWGPGDNHLVPRIIGRARHLRRVGDGRNLVDTVYIDNAADAHILAAEVLKTRPELSGRKYFISQGEPMPLWEMINAILEAAGLPPVRKSISLRTARRLGGVMEILYRFLRLENEPPMTRFVAEELATSHWFDIGAARRDLGYRPVVSTAEGLLRLARWLDPSRSKGSKIKT